MALAAGAIITQTDRQILRDLGPQEGYYWSVAQYEIAYVRAREEIRAAALGATESDDKLALRVAVLMSKERILTADSELKDSFKAVPGYLEASTAIAAFHSRVDPMMETPVSVRQHAEAINEEFEKIESTILRLANDVRLQEITTRGRTIESLVLRRRLIWSAMWLIVVLLLLWVWTVSASWSRYLRAALAREQALDAERAAVEAKTQFLGMVSHELRSPLQSIISSLDLLESKHLVVPAQAELTKSIRRSANDLSVQLRDLLTLARGQSGRIELRPEVFDASELVREAVEFERPRALANGLDLTVTTEPANLFVVADSGRIGQLLHNLIDNALRYTPSGSVTVTLEAFDSAASTLRFSVADTGPGLPSHAIALVTQGLDSPASAPQSGVRRGIGLAVVRALIKQLGGSVAVRSRVESISNSGTIFTLTIPAVLAEDEPASLRSGEGWMLVVDDRPELLHCFLRVARELGLQCDTASSAAMALNLLAAHPYATVLIDLNMPGISGSELATKIRCEGMNRESRLVAMSANSEAASDGELLHFDAVLEKPIDKLRLEAAIAVRTRSTTPPR